MLHVRVTRLAANTVSLLSALVLYIFATGAVKGFGFALGLSTIIEALPLLPQDVHLAVVGPSGWGDAAAARADIQESVERYARAADKPKF